MKLKTDNEKAHELTNLDVHLKEFNEYRKFIILLAIYSESDLTYEAHQELDWMHRKYVLNEIDEENTGELSCIDCGESKPVSELLGMKCEKCREKRSGYIAKPDFMETSDFYDLMQSYRIADQADQSNVIKWYEAVKQFIREHFTPKSIGNQ